MNVHENRGRTMGIKDMSVAAPRGRFITFEGIEGSGKSLQIQLLSQYLSERDIPHQVTREPGGTPLGNQLRSVLLESAGPQRTAIAELLLYLADRYQDLAEVIEPALVAGKHVLCDRYHDATRAYQGCARGIDLRLIDSVARILRIRKPDLTLILDLSAKKGLERAAGRNREEHTGLGRFEAESLRFHRRVRAAYKEFALREPQRFSVISASGTPESVHRRVLAAVGPLLRLEP